MDDKISQEIFNPVNENLKKLAQLFPAVLKDGQVDLEALKQELGEFEEVGKEKYELSWPGKTQAKQLANTDISGKTLKYIPEDSKDADTTENLYIEGDNLEVLKLLRYSYYGKIKMIYIDPPYNTGNDFVYKDKYAKDHKSSEIEIGDLDEDGERLIKNQFGSSRFHSNWLNMIYPRLKISKDLLTDDGVIFISIDDNEVDNLKKMCDELFSEENYINTVAVKMKNIAGASGGGEDKKLKKNIEYIHIYAKNYSAFQSFDSVYNYTKIDDLVQQYREDGVSWKYTTALIYEGEKEYIGSTVDGDGNEIKIYSRKNAIIKSINQIMLDEEISESQAYNKYASKVFQTQMPQSSIRPRVMKKVKELNVDGDLFSIEYVPKSGKNKGEIYEQYYKGDNFRLFAWLRDVSEEIDGTLYKKDMQGTLWDFVGETKNLTKEGNVPFPNGKKPLALIKRLLSMQADKSSVIIDFFSGSATSAHATMQLNAEDSGNRKFIMVQLPEPCSENSEALKEGYRNICEIGKERIRRAGEKIKEENKDKEGIENLDFGFKVFRVADTNIRWGSKEFEFGQIIDREAIMSEKDKTDFTPEFTDIDVVYEIMLRHRDFPLSSPIDQLRNIGERTYIISDSIVVCLEEKITEAIIDMIAALEPKPDKVIFRDTAFDDDISLKLNSMKRLDSQLKKHNQGNKDTYRVEFI